MKKGAVGSLLTKLLNKKSKKIKKLLSSFRAGDWIIPHPKFNPVILF
jgi:hypothetical protein